MKHAEKEVVVSGGSSCHSSSAKPSAVLLAMGVDEKVSFLPLFFLFFLFFNLLSFFVLSWQEEL